MDVIQLLDEEIRFLTSDWDLLFETEDIDMFIQTVWDDLIHISKKSIGMLDPISFYYLLYWGQLRLKDVNSAIDTLKSISSRHSPNIRTLPFLDFPTKDFHKNFKLTLKSQWNRWLNSVDANDDNLCHEHPDRVKKYFNSFIDNARKKCIKENQFVGTCINLKTLTHSPLHTNIDKNNLGLCFVEEHDLSIFDTIVLSKE